MRSTISSLALLFTGFFTGACLVVALILVPYWRSLEAQAFLDYFVLWAPTIGKTMLPLEAMAQIFLIWACFNSRRDKVLFRWWLLATILFGLTFGLFFAYFAGVNSSFINKSVTAEEVVSLLTQWNLVHWLRTAFAGMACVLSVMAVSRENTNL